MADAGNKAREHLDDSVERPSSSGSGADRQSASPPRPAAPQVGVGASRAAPPADLPVLPQRSSDETDLGWGDQQSGYDDDWYLAERPPHHGD